MRKKSLNKHKYKNDLFKIYNKNTSDFRRKILKYLYLKNLINYEQCSDLLSILQLFYKLFNLFQQETYMSYGVEMDSFDTIVNIFASEICLALSKQHFMTTAVISGNTATEKDFLIGTFVISVPVISRNC